MLNLIHARSFVTVIATRGVRAAARELDLAPSTIVDHIRQLEEVLAAPLVVRQRGSAMPTDQGARFLPLARALVETAGRVRSLIHLPALRLAASSNVGIYLLQPHIAAFRQCAGIPVEQWIGSNSDVVARLERGEADVAAMEWWDGRPGFTARTWRREPLVVIVGPGHRWARRGSVPVTDLQTEPLLGGEVRHRNWLSVAPAIGTNREIADHHRRFRQHRGCQARGPRRLRCVDCHGSLCCRRNCDRAACRPSYRRGRTRQGDHADRPRDFASYRAGNGNVRRGAELGAGSSRLAVVSRPPAIGCSAIRAVACSIRATSWAAALGLSFAMYAKISSRSASAPRSNRSFMRCDSG